MSPAPSPHPDLRILSSRVYRGPNVWHYEPAIQLVVDLGVLEDFPTTCCPASPTRLVERLPGLASHSCSRGRRGGFVERLHEGTWLGHVAEHVALQLQQAVGHDMRRGKTRQVKRRARALQRHLRLRRRDRRPGRRASWPCGWSTTWSSTTRTSTSTPSWSASSSAASGRAFGPSTQAIVDEAVSRDIPWLRLNTASLVQLGQGVHQQRIRATMTSIPPRSPSTSPATRS